MNHKKIKILIAGLSLFSTMVLAAGWWNSDWASRRQITLDGGATGADIQGTVSDFPLLLRLHAGNFPYFAELAENGKDIRLMASDDKTPLHHSVEKLDALNELGLVWVRLPQVKGGGTGEPFWLYYGNAAAEDGSDSKSLYDVNQGLVYHFSEAETLPQDATAYGTHATSSKASPDSAGWIGAAARFNGSGPITINPVPQLSVDPARGWTFSTWVKIDQAQPAGASLLEAKDASNLIVINFQGTAVFAQWQGPTGKTQTSAVNLTTGKWQNLALVLSKDKLELYLDGQPVGNAGLNLAAFSPTVSLGQNMTGLLDEVQIAATSRSSDWIKLSYRTQSPDFQTLAFGQDESGGEAGGGHFSVIVQNVTLDGWIIIGLTGIMFIVALLVMIFKWLLISRTVKANKAFLEKYEQLDKGHLGDLDQPDEGTQQDGIGTQSLTGELSGESSFKNSTLYSLYHTGIRELNKLTGSSDGPLTSEAWDYLRVKLDSQVVRENQKLNSQMVLLTIAIAGGPFLGLLGTVLGVMITFAVIAATGDVNINSIAPGIAAALLATVAGLAVAIPALFAYNYLLTKIKDVVADMRVFTDEFLALLAMRAAGRKASRGE